MSLVKGGVMRGINVLPPALAFQAEAVIGSIPNRWRRGMRRRLERLYAAAGEPRAVMQGPFAGMRLWFRARASVTMACPMMAKLLGTYEMEVHGALESAIASEPDVVVDVGASDGFYVVGLARRLPRTRVIAFETMAPAVHALRRNHEMNGRPGRVEVHGWCDDAALSSALEGAHRPLVFCDIDGGEGAVLDPARAPALRRAEVIVEVHEPLAKGVSSLLRARFGPSHEIEEIRERARTVADRPAGCPLSDEDFLEAAKEFRGDVPGVWYWMRPR